MTGPDSTTASGIGFVVTASGVSKAFGRRRICTDISFVLRRGDRLAVVGPNGSGKTTFLKILCGLLRPDRGTITYHFHGTTVPRNHWHALVGLVAPDLALYDELTALENIRFLNDVGGWGKTGGQLRSLLGDVGLAGREHDLLSTFSSGMKQRLKYAAVLVKAPPLLLLDEPTANFDDSGAAIFHEVIQRQRAAGICILATNNKQEAELAERHIVMGE
jgi:heme exporter protein A